MKHYIELIFILMICSVSVIPAPAQTKQLTEVSVDLGSGVIVGPLGLPYDVPFRIKGNTMPNIRTISLTYQVSSSYDSAKATKLQWKGNANTTPSTWSYLGDQTEWRLSVGPIHPNVPYDFIFKVTRVPDVKAPENEKFKEEAYKILEDYYENLSAIDSEAISSTNIALNSQLKALIPPNQMIIYPDGTEYTIDIKDPPFSSLLMILKDVKFERMKMETNLETIQDIFTLSEHDYYGFRKRLDSIINSPNLLSEKSKAIMNDVIDKGNSKYNSLRMIDIGHIVVQPSHRIDEVYNGKMTLNSKANALESSQQPDIELMQLTYQFYSRLSDNLTDTKERNVFTDTDISLLTVLLGFLRDITEAQILFKDNLTELKNSTLAKFPDVLADKFISATYIVTDQSYIDAVSQSSPYIGLDVGLAYIPGYSQLFIYEGVNFYFMPVNKDAPLSYFTKSKYWWLKRLSLHLGLTQNLIKVENDRYVPLIDNVGSLLIGAGVRINRIIRVNTGYMFFFEEDNNPLKDTKYFTALPLFSLTFDINIAKALGGFGTRLKLNP